MSQSAVHAINWYTSPRSLNSALKWTNSFKLDILDHSWTPLPTTGHTGPVDAILSSICQELASLVIRSLFRRTCRKLIRIGYTLSTVAIIGHTSLWQDILYDYGQLLATFALTLHFDLNMIKPDRKWQNCSKKGNTWTNMALICYFTAL